MLMLLISVLYPHSYQKQKTKKLTLHSSPYDNPDSQPRIHIPQEKAENLFNEWMNIPTFLSPSNFFLPVESFLLTPFFLPQPCCEFCCSIDV